jgi:PRD domain protein (TIGR03582 family)
MSDIENIILSLEESVEIDDVDRTDLQSLLKLVVDHARREGLTIERERMLAIASHLLAFARRVRRQEYLSPIDDTLFSQVKAETLEQSRALLKHFCENRNYQLTDTEAFLLAIHFETLYLHTGG